MGGDGHRLTLPDPDAPIATVHRLDHCALSVVTGPTSVLLHEHSPALDYLSFSVPGWGGGGEQLGVADVIFLAFYAAAAWRHGLRECLSRIRD